VVAFERKKHVGNEEGKGRAGEAGGPSTRCNGRENPGRRETRSVWTAVVLQAERVDSRAETTHLALRSGTERKGKAQEELSTS